MKKLLLSLAVALGFASAQAAPVVVDFASADNLPTAESATAESATINGVPFSFVNCKKGTYQSNSYLQISGKSYMESAYVSFTYTQPVNAIMVHTSAAASTTVSVQLYANDVAVGTPTVLSAQNADFTFDVPAANQAAGTVYKFMCTNTKNAQFTSLTINPGQQGGGGTTTETLEVGSIAAFKAASAHTGLIKFTAPVTAVYQNGRYLFVEDATGSLLLYGDLTTKYNNGDQVPAGFTGKYQNYQNGLIQMSSLDPATFAAGTPGTAVEPGELTVEEIGLGMVNDYVVLKGVSVAADPAKANTFQLTDATGTINLYNQFNNAQYYDVVTVTEGSDLDVVAFVGCYGGAAQLTAVSVTSATGQQFVATPVFSVAAGAVDAGTEVVIACATEGASIHYTLDGSEPTAACTLYSAPVVINEACTLKAIAVKEGMADSNVAEAAYTIKAVEPVDPNAKEVTFNFADPSSINADWTLENAVDDGTTGNKKIDLPASGELFAKAPVTVSGEATGTAPRIYYQPAKEAWGFRIYKSSTLTIAVAEGYTLKSIVFDPQSTTYANVLKAMTVDNGTLTDNVWTAGEGATSVTLSGATGTVGFNNFKVVYVDKSSVADVTVDNAAVEYFNLQGVRVLNPENGLYIRRQGNKVTKVVL